MPSKGTVNNPDGAPQKIEVSDEIIKKAARLYGLGIKQEVIADSLGVSLATLKRYMNKFPELKKEMQEHLATAREHLVTNFWKRALDPKCSDRMMMFALKTQAGFVEKDDNIHEVKVTHSSTDLILQSMKIAGSPEDDDTIEADIEDAT